MARLLALIIAFDLPASEEKVPDDIEQLVPHELVLRLQAAGVQDDVALDDDRVVQRSPKTLAHRVKLFGLTGETEGAGPGHIAREGAGLHGETDFLAADRLGRKVDGD